MKTLLEKLKLSSGMGLALACVLAVILGAGTGVGLAKLTAAQPIAVDAGTAAGGESPAEDPSQGGGDAQGGGDVQGGEQGTQGEDQGGSPPGDGSGDGNGPVGTAALEGAKDAAALMAGAQQVADWLNSAGPVDATSLEQVPKRLAQGLYWSPQTGSISYDEAGTIVTYLCVSGDKAVAQQEACS